MHIELMPEQLAIYGLQAADVLQTVNAAYHGTAAAQLDQADRSVPVAVRIIGRGRRSAGPSARSCCAGATGALVPAVRGRQDRRGARAQPHRSPGRAAAADRGGGAAGGGSGRVCADGTPSDAAKVLLPAGVYLRYGGAAEAQAAAARELLLHSAAAFVLIVLLLALAFGSSRHVLIVLVALPSTLIGGVAAVALTGATLTLGAMVGFVALFGMAARNTILLISHYDHLVGGGGRPLVASRPRCEGPRSA